LRQKNDPFKEFEDLREPGAPVLIASGTSRDRTH
jgi:hypothetical protein